MDTIEVKTSLSSFKKGGKPCYQLYLKNPKKMTQEEFVQRFASAINETTAKARFINDMHGQVFCEGIVQNYVVNTGSLRGSLVATGSIPSAGAPLSKTDNPIEVSILAAGELKTRVGEITAVNNTLVVESVLYTVQYDTSDDLNTIEGNGLIKINGNLLKINEANDDEGVWLEDLDGTIISDKALISTNEANTLNVSFSELPELDDTDRCRLVISTRNCESKDSYGTTRLERIVRIVPAA